MHTKQVRIPLRLNATLRLACKEGESSIALDAVRLAPLYSRARRRALNAALRLAKTPYEFRMIYRFAEPGSRLEHRVVAKWARLVEAEGELLELLKVVRALKRSGRLERLVLRKLRRFGYRDWWEPMRDLVRSWFPLRKFA